MNDHLPRFLTDPTWQMPFGERAALEGILATLEPRLSIEIGTAEGGSLRRIMAHSDEIHAFDLDLSRVAGLAGGKVHLHEGDSHELLPGLLRRFADQGRTVDFALIDGDHSVEGVRADVTAFLESPATEGCLVLLHDTMNAAVREGIWGAVDAVGPSVQYSLNLDLVPGLLSLQPPFEGLWAGLGMLLVGVETPLAFPHFDSFLPLAAEWELREAGEAPDERTDSALLAKIEQQRTWLQQMRGSASWRITAPLRGLKRLLRRAPRA